MSYEAAKMTVQQSEDAPTSRKRYYKWWDSVRPVAIPKYPYRVYLDEWLGWGDFLGVENEFVLNSGGEYRPYWEAVRWVQKQRYKSSGEYYAAYERGEVPEDIPKAPISYYGDQFLGWRNWLGKDLENILMNEKAKIGLFAIANILGNPRNVVQVVVAKDGQSELMDVCKERQLDPIRVWHWEDDLAAQVEQIFRACAHDHGGGEWLVPNLNTLIFELDSLLLRYVVTVDSNS
jgi:hypothetical protein